MASRPLTARLAGLPLRWFGAGAGALALAVSGLFGGLAPAKLPASPQVKPSTVSSGTPWNVTVITCRVVSDLSPLMPDHDGDRWFIVLATIEVTADDSQDLIQDAIGLPHVPGLTDKKPAHVVLARDSSDVTYLNPGMPERVGFIWEQSASVPLPTSALVQIYGKTRQISSLTGNGEWSAPSVRAEVQTPVEDRRT